MFRKSLTVEQGQPVSHDVTGASAGGAATSHQMFCKQNLRQRLLNEQDRETYMRGMVHLLESTENVLYSLELGIFGLFTATAASVQCSVRCCIENIKKFDSLNNCLFVHCDFFLNIMLIEAMTYLSVCGFIGNPIPPNNKTLQRNVIIMRRYNR